MNDASPVAVERNVHRPAGRPDEQPLRVLHCIPNLALGGAQRVVIELIRQLQPRGINVGIAVIGSREISVDWPSLSVEPSYLGYNGATRDVGARAKAGRTLRQIVESEDIDLVHSHLWVASTVAGSALKGLSVPHLVHVHDTRPWVTGGGLRNTVRRWWTKRCLSGANTRFVAVSNEAWSYNSRPLRWAGREFDVIANGVNTDEFHARDEGTDRDSNVVRVGVVARFNPEKGHANLVRAVARLIREGVPLQLHLAGTGTLLDETRQLSAELGIASSVRFIGMTTDVPGFLHTLDIFVLPSLACEGMPLSVLEAMAVGLPVVATDVGGTSEVVLDDVTGLLVPPGDIPALSGAIRSLADDRERRRRLAKEAVSRIHQQHTWAGVARRIEQIYRQMVGRAEASSAH